MSQNLTSPEDLAQAFQRLTMSTTSRRPETPSAQANPVPGIAHSSIKVKTPETYHGDRSKLRAFISQCETYIRFNRQALATNEDKVIFCATYLRGSAYDWFEPTLTDYLENNPGDRKEHTTATFNSYIQFKTDLKKVYGSINEERTADRQIRALRQTTSVTEYASKFQQILSRLDWEGNAITSEFYNGLKDSVKDEISRMDRPEDLAEMIETAVRIDNRIYERQMERTRGRTAFQPRYKANSSKSKNPYPGLYPREMDLDATQHKGPKKTFKPRKGGLSKAQRKERMQKNLCLYCGKPGHRAKECPNKQQLHATQGAPTTELPSHPALKNDPEEWKVVDKIEPNGTWDANEADPTEPPKLELPPPAHKRTPEQEYACLSWTGCYEDDYLIHKSDKDATGWYPKKPKRKQNKAKDGKSLCVTTMVPPKRVPQKILFDDKYVEMITKFWERLECKDWACEIESQHYHKFFTPEKAPQNTKAKLRLLICQEEECPDLHFGNIHCHQGRSQRGETNEQFVEASHAVYSPQSLSMTQMESSEEDDWVILEEEKPASEIPTPKTR
jgi:Retrotransposon gag protein/Zinc knuckle